MSIRPATLSIRPATHVLYRSDFKDESMWEGILESHGLADRDIDEITIRAIIECVD